jgi:hypothetical protein
MSKTTSAPACTPTSEVAEGCCTRIQNATRSFFAALQSRDYTVAMSIADRHSLPVHSPEFCAIGMTCPGVWEALVSSLGSAGTAWGDEVDSKPAGPNRQTKLPVHQARRLEAVVRWIVDRGRCPVTETLSVSWCDDALRGVLGEGPRGKQASESNVGCTVLEYVYRIIYTTRDDVGVDMDDDAGYEDGELRELETMHRSFQTLRRTFGEPLLHPGSPNGRTLMPLVAAVALAPPVPSRVAMRCLDQKRHQLDGALLVRMSPVLQMIIERDGADTTIDAADFTVDDVTLLVLTAQVGATSAIQLVGSHEGGSVDVHKRLAPRVAAALCLADRWLMSEVRTDLERHLHVDLGTVPDVIRVATRLVNEDLQDMCARYLMAQSPQIFTSRAQLYDPDVVEALDECSDRMDAEHRTGTKRLRGW